jgi:hypothetical protein
MYWGTPLMIIWNWKNILVLWYAWEQQQVDVFNMLVEGEELQQWYGATLHEMEEKTGNPDDVIM